MLSPEQMKLVDEGIAFYREAGDIIRDGISSFYGDMSESWRKPEGWQAVCRRLESGETLVVLHTFGGELPREAALPVKGARLRRLFREPREGRMDGASLRGDGLHIELRGNYEAVAAIID